MVSECVTSGHRYRVTSNIQFRASRKLRHCDIIRHNLDKYSNIVRNMIHTSTTNGPLVVAATIQPETEDQFEPVLKEVYVFVNNVNCSKTMYPQFGSGSPSSTTNGGVVEMLDESYSIEVQANNGKAILFAENVWGAIRALETFSQMLYIGKNPSITSSSMFNTTTANISNINDGDGGTMTETEQQQERKKSSFPQHKAHCLPISTSVYVNVSRIQDRPRFRYRSIMIDTARHFIPIKVIIKNLVSDIIK